jgi:hypothetical protein
LRLIATDGDAQMSSSPAASSSTVDKLLRMVRFQNRLKVVDLSRTELVAKGLEQVR